MILLFDFGSLGTIFGAGLAAVRDTGGVQRTSHDVISDTREVFDSAAADEDHTVLLEIVSNSGNVGRYLDTVGQADPGDLTKSRVRLLGGDGLNRGANSSLLG